MNNSRQQPNRIIGLLGFFLLLAVVFCSSEFALRGSAPNQVDTIIHAKTTADYSVWPHGSFKRISPKLETVVAEEITDIPQGSGGIVNLITNTPVSIAQNSTERPVNSLTPTALTANLSSSSTPTSTLTAVVLSETPTPSTTSTATSTAVPTLTLTVTSSSTVATPTLTSTATSTRTVFPTRTFTAIPILLPTLTLTPTNTPTNVVPSQTPRPASTNTPVPTFTPSITRTPTATSTHTHTPTVTPSSTFTPTNTLTSTNTFTPTNTSTPTDTFTPSNTPTPTSTPIPYYPLAHQVTSSIAFGPEAGTGSVFFTQTFGIVYTGGPVVLSANADGTGNTLVDDIIIINITRPDSSTATYTHDYNNPMPCGGDQGLPPVDLTSYFQPGNNVVTITLKDSTCGGYSGASNVWLGVPVAPTNTPNPTATDTATNTATATATATPVPTNTDTPTHTPTLTNTPTPTATDTATNTATATATGTPVPTNTDTPTATP